MRSYLHLIKTIKDHCIGNPEVPGVMIEIGTTREILEGHDSTPVLHKFCIDNNINFTTVDMDPDNTSNIKNRIPDINAVTSKGEDFLRDFKGSIDYIYLDAFDFYHDNHSQDRINKYKTILNTTINNADCHQMHLDCCINMLNKLSPNCVITFDDVLNDSFDGKGKTAIPFLLNNGFKIFSSIDHSCTLIRI